jgi:hypothetical protein
MHSATPIETLGVPPTAITTNQTLQLPPFYHALGLLSSPILRIGLGRSRSCRDAGRRGCVARGRNMPAGRAS